jgi:hypothetical protein
MRVTGDDGIRCRRQAVGGASWKEVCKQQRQACLSGDRTALWPSYSSDVDKLGTQDHGHTSARAISGFLSTTESARAILASSRSGAFS